MVYDSGRDTVVLFGGFDGLTRYGDTWEGTWSGSTAPCDVNCDGSVNGFDVQTFVEQLYGFAVKCSFCAGDVNGDGAFDGFDIGPFFDALIAGGC
ncbi:MAG: hypothetical protein CHACPFDD_00441 [Phycisphaerae bacterium]|nr:hypothetical protein [Phycisphaerae bacterium]